MKPPTCQHCNRKAKCVGGQQIYPHRPDLFKKWFWLCEGCGAYCGCHPKSKRPLGSPANSATRMARNAAHRAFDPLWRRGPFNRSQAYAWLSEQTGLPVSECHIGMMNVEQCDLVVDAVRTFNEHAELVEGQ